MRTSCVGYLVVPNKDVVKGDIQPYVGVPDETLVMTRLVVDKDKERIVRWYLEPMKKPVIKDSKHLEKLEKDGFYGKIVKQAESWESELGISIN